MTEERKFELRQVLGHFETTFYEHMCLLSKDVNYARASKLRIERRDEDFLIVTDQPGSADEPAMWQESSSLALFINGYEDIRTNLAGNSFVGVAGAADPVAKMLVCLKQWLDGPNSMSLGKSENA